MAKGENIFKRKDGRWEARYVKGYDSAGKIKYGFCYGKTYKEAKEKVTKCKTSLLCGAAIPKTSPRKQFEFYCDEWIQISKNRLKDSTYMKYCMILDRHIKPKLGGCHPLGITNEMIDEFTEELLNGKGLAPKTVKDILVLLRAILKYTEKQFPRVFPVIEINYPRDVKKEMRVLSIEEQKIFIQYLMVDMDECKFGILLALYTGIRIGELCALQWENISVNEGTIKIASTMQRIKNMNTDNDTKTKIIIDSPKTDKSVRTIPITDHLIELCKQMEPKNKKAFVLTGSFRYMEPRTLQYRFKKYMDECKLEGLHFHTLRHTFATRCVEVDFDIKSLSEILGHSTTTITLERYVHSSMNLKRSNMNKLTQIGW